MSNTLLHEIDQWCSAHREEHLSLLKTFAAIPAPSHEEDRRVSFILSYLEEIGAEGAYADGAKNVLLPFGCGMKAESGDGAEDMMAVPSGIHVFAAHTDIVFPDTEPLPVTEQDGKLFAPGVGDDSANAAALLMIVKFLVEHGAEPLEPVLFAWNSCEEGLGNLKGTRRIFDDFSGRICDFVSFDGTYRSIVTRAVGSERWRVTCRTPGGHSYGAFGTPNAIAHLAGLIKALDRKKVPKKRGRKTTYNFGVINGGTTVNSIPAEAALLYEYRSDELSHLIEMRSRFHAALSAAERKDVSFTAELLGERPCGAELTGTEEAALIRRCKNAVERVTGTEPFLRSGSTDANIPLSLGIPAATFGLYLGDREHSREEFLEIESIFSGLKIGLPLAASYFKIQTGDEGHGKL